MNSEYTVIPFFPYHKDGEFVHLSRFIRGKKEGESDLIQILKPARNGRLPRVGEDGVRCLVKKVDNTRYNEVGQKIDEYEFCAVVPKTAEFEWQQDRKCWSTTISVGRYKIVYRVRVQDADKLPNDSSSCVVQWIIRPFHVQFVSEREDFFVICVQLDKELTPDRVIRRQIENGHREEWSPSNGTTKMVKKNRKAKKVKSNDLAAA